MRPAFLFVALSVFLVAAGSSRVYRNDAVKVRAFAPPAGWELAPQPSYPRLLASYSHAEGARITLSGQKVSSSTTALELAGQARQPMEKQGFTALRITRDGERVRLDADLDGGRRFLKQVYVVANGWAYVVTLISPLAAAPRCTPDFEDAVRSLQLSGSEPSSPDAGAGR